MEALIAVGTGLLLLLVEHFVIQRWSRGSEPPSTQNNARIKGHGNSITQVVDERRTLVVNRVANIHHHHQPSGGGGSGGGGSSDDLWLWLGGAFAAIIVLAVGISMYGDILRAVMAGVALGLLFLAGALSLRGSGTEVPIGRWVTGCVCIAVAIAGGAFGLLTREFNGISLPAIKEHLEGLPKAEWVGALLEFGGVGVAEAFATQAMGALVLVFCAAMLILRVTGVFAAIGALQGPGSTGRLQAWLVKRLYDDSLGFVVGMIVFAAFGAALSSGWIGALLIAQMNAGGVLPTP